MEYSMPLCWFHYHLSRYLTFQHIYFTFYRWKPNTRGQALNPSATNVHAAINLDINSSIAGSTNTQWKSALSKMTYIWTVVVLGVTLFLPSVLIDLIFCNYVIINVPCRTTVALFLHPYIFDRIYLKLIVTVAFLLSAASGASASILLAHKERLRSAKKREAWVDASKYPKKFSSINFWTCLASPLTTLIWWVIRTLCQIGHPESDRLTYRAAGLCLVAVLSLTWQTTSVVSYPMSKVDVVVVGVIALLTAMIAFGQVYRVFSLVRY